MDYKKSQTLFEHYTQGWKQNDIQLITSCLEENVTIIESHGPTYSSIQDIEQWFGFWLSDLAPV